MLQGVLPIYSIEIKIQWPYFPCTPLIITLPLYLVARVFVRTCVVHRRPPGNISVLLKIFPVGMISFYVAHILDICFNISHQRRWNTKPIGFSGWFEVLIKIDRNWLHCCQLAQFGGKLLFSTTIKFLNCNGFGLPIIFYTGMP